MMDKSCEGNFVLNLHCLGSAGYHPNDDRHTSCYCVPEAGLVLDAGSGIYRLGDLIETDQLDLVLSHAHLDHIVGLTFLLDVLHYAEKRRERTVDRLRIFGEQAKLDAIQTHLFSELIFPVELSAEWIAIDDSPSFKAAGADVSWRRQPHPGGSVAYRFDWGDRVLVYATDTSGFTQADDLDWMKHADVLMHECYFRDEHQDWALKTGHSWTSRVASIARTVDPAKLIITHLNPLDRGDDPVGKEALAASFAGELLIAGDGLVTRVGG